MPTGKCLGIPVIYDPTLTEIAHSRGFLFWKTIVIGPLFTAFAAREQQAILLHEAGHCKLWHAERCLWPLLRAILLHPALALAAALQRDPVRTEMLWSEWIERSGIAELRRAQEYQADYYAAQCGYGADLARAYSRVCEQYAPVYRAGIWFQSSADRIRALGFDTPQPQGLVSAPMTPPAPGRRSPCS